MNLLATMRQSGIILDACCAITMATSGEARDILAATGKSIYIATYVLNQEIKRPQQLAVVAELVTLGMIMSVSPANEVEEDMYVWLASLNLDNGECVTGAIASQREWAVAVDENKAHAKFARELPGVVRLTTPGPTIQLGRINASIATEDLVCCGADSVARSLQAQSCAFLARLVAIPHTNWYGKWQLMLPGERRCPPR